jgi:hypothetical protein
MYCSRLKYNSYTIPNPTNNPSLTPLVFQSFLQWKINTNIPRFFMLTSNILNFEHLALNSFIIQKPVQPAGWYGSSFFFSPIPLKLLWDEFGISLPDEGKALNPTWSKVHPPEVSEICVVAIEVPVATVLLPLVERTVRIDRGLVAFRAGCCGLDSSPNASHCFGSGLGELRSPCWSSFKAPSIFSLGCYRGEKRRKRQFQKCENLVSI